MGETYTTLKIYGPRGVEEVEALVDTGTTFTKIPLSLGERLGLRVRRKVEVRLSDERVVERGLCYAEVEVDGVRDLIPVALSGEGEAPLVGYTTLEILGFKINPVTASLERTLPVEYWLHVTFGLQGSSLLGSHPLELALGDSFKLSFRTVN